MKNLLLGCGPRPIHPQHILAMEKIAPTADLSEWVLIDKYVKEAGILNYDATKLPYKNEEIDVVYSSHLLEHFGFKESQSALMEWFRVLRPEGKIFINVPDMEWLAEEMLRLGMEVAPRSRVFDTQEKLMEVVYGNQDHEGEFHKSGYTKFSLGALLMKIGFKNIEIEQIYEAHEMGVLIATATK